jgi:hypothetical protein
MKTLNTTTFKNFSLTLGLLVLGFFSQAQGTYAPLTSATSFVDGATATNPNSGLDLWYDFGWRRSGTGITVARTNGLLNITLPNNSTVTRFRTIDFTLTSANTVTFTFNVSNNGNNARTLDINVINISNNTVARTTRLTQSTTPDLRSGATNLPINLSGITPGNYAIEFVYQSANASLTFSGFSTNATPSILPVTYASLSAKPLVNAVKIEWATTNEVNNSHFEIERTNDGENWSTIGTVEGNGNTFALTNYEFVDNTPAQGVNVYRLKQVDWNGDFEYSITKTVVWGGESTKNNVQVYPNPGVNVIHVTGVDNPTVTVYNMAGSVMIQSSNTNSLDLQELLKGVYFIHVQNPAGEVSRIRFIKE